MINVYELAHPIADLLYAALKENKIPKIGIEEIREEVHRHTVDNKCSSQDIRYLEEKVTRLIVWKTCRDWN